MKYLYAVQQLGRFITITVFTVAACFSWAANPTSYGTGFSITDDGHIVTNHHVVEDGKSFKVRLKDKLYPAKLIKSDKRFDLAILKIEAKTKGLPIAPSRNVGLGEEVFTVGYPNVELQGVAPKFTKGSISSLSGIKDADFMFQISVPIQPGNSGGALVNSKGNVIGVVVGVLKSSSTLKDRGVIPQNVNYAVKSSFLLATIENQAAILKSLKKKLCRSRLLNLPSTRHC